MRFFLFGVYILSSLSSPLGWSYDSHYNKESEIPEPLLFDLVRRINSHKGEFEVNTLVVHRSDSELKGIDVSPEIEYAFADGMGIELELPTSDGKIHTFKSALQFQIPNWLGDISGIQIMHERFNGKSLDESSLLFLTGKRLNKDWSIFAMIGGRLAYGKDFELSEYGDRIIPLVNINFFYDYGRTFDLGLEMNVKGGGASFNEVVLMPQVHALLKDDVKIQFGFGVSHDGYKLSPLSAFRLIKEYN